MERDKVDLAELRDAELDDVIGGASVGPLVCIP